MRVSLLCASVVWHTNNPTSTFYQLPRGTWWRGGLSEATGSTFKRTPLPCQGWCWLATVNTQICWLGASVFVHTASERLAWASRSVMIGTGQDFLDTVWKIAGFLKTDEDQICITSSSSWWLKQVTGRPWFTGRGYPGTWVLGAHCHRSLKL